MRAHYRTTNEPLTAHDLEKNGVHYRHLGLDKAVFQPVLDELSQKRGYGTQDEVKLNGDTPNLPVVLKKFDGEHLHEDDEVRFLLDGEGVFDIRANDERWMRIVVEAGDLIVVPKGKHHRFELTELCRIHCVRLFKDVAGWVPVYRESPPAG
ncbi:MAG: cupin domain-containing protein [Deltaproteobacteria bacterium]|nr:cupin domain-containing protein [Deltaproteobacteria bacterium]